MPYIGHDSTLKISRGGLTLYSPDLIHRAILAIEEECKSDYTQPDSLPYQNPNMARQFLQSGTDSIEQRERKQAQAQFSRLSRDRTKFMRERMEETINASKTVLHEHIKRLVNLECYVNVWLMQNGQPPFDWRNVWEDDACGPCDSSEDDESRSPMTDYYDYNDVASMDERNDQRMIDSDEAASVNDDATIYENHADGIRNSGH